MTKTILYPWEKQTLLLDTLFPDHPLRGQPIFSKRNNEQFFENQIIFDYVKSFTNNHYINKDNFEVMFSQMAERLPYIFNVSSQHESSFFYSWSRIDGNYEHHDNVRVLVPFGDPGLVLRTRSSIIDYVASYLYQHDFKDINLKCLADYSDPLYSKIIPLSPDTRNAVSFKALYTTIVNSWSNLTLAKVLSKLSKTGGALSLWDIVEDYSEIENQGVMQDLSSLFLVRSSSILNMIRMKQTLIFSRNYSRLHNSNELSQSVNLTNPLAQEKLEDYFKVHLFPKSFETSVDKWNFIKNSFLVFENSNDIRIFRINKEKLITKYTLQQATEIWDRANDEEKNILDQDLWLDKEREYYLIDFEAIRSKFVKAYDFEDKKDNFSSLLEEGVNEINDFEDINDLGASLINDLTDEFKDREDYSEIQQAIQEMDDSNVSPETILLEKENFSEEQRVIFYVISTLSEYDPENIESLNKIARLHSIIPDSIIFKEKYMEKLDRIKKISFAFDKGIADVINNTIQIMSDPLLKVKNLIQNLNSADKADNIAEINSGIINTISNMEDELNKLDSMSDITPFEKIVQYHRMESRPTFNFISSEPQLSFTNYLDQLRSWYLSKVNINKKRNLDTYEKLGVIKQGLENLKLSFPNPENLLKTISKLILRTGTAALNAANNSISVIDNIFELFRDIRLPITAIKPDLRIKRKLFFYDTQEFLIKTRDYGNSFIIPIYQNRKIGDKYIKAFSLLNEFSTNFTEKELVLYESPYHEEPQYGILLKLSSEEAIFWENRFNEIKSGHDFTGLDKYIALITNTSLKKVNPNLTDSEKTIAASAVLAQIGIASAAAISSTPGLITKLIAAASAAVMISISNATAAKMWFDKFVNWSEEDDLLVFSSEKEEIPLTNPVLKIFSPLNSLSFIPWSNFKMNIRLIQFSGGLTAALAGSVAVGMVTGKIASSIRTKIRSRKVWKHHRKNKTVIDEGKKRKEINEHRYIKDAEGKVITDKNGKPLLLSKQELKRKIAMRTFMSGFSTNSSKDGTLKLGILSNMSRVGLKTLDVLGDKVIGKGFDKVFKKFKKDSKIEEELEKEIQIGKLVKKTPDSEILKRIKKIQKELGN